MMKFMSVVVLVVYDQQLYIVVGVVDVWDVQVLFGYCIGIVMVLYFFWWCYFFFGVDWLVVFFLLGDWLVKLVVMLQVVVVYVQYVVIQVFDVELDVFDQDVFWFMLWEVEILCWMMDGKSLGVIGEIFGISYLVV